MKTVILSVTDFDTLTSKYPEVYVNTSESFKEIEDVGVKEVCGKYPRRFTLKNVLYVENPHKVQSPN